MKTETCLSLSVEPRITPDLDPAFVPAVLWNRAYGDLAQSNPASRACRIALQRPNGTCFVREALLLPDGAAYDALNLKYLERLVKFLLWHQGGSRVLIAGCPELTERLASQYTADGARAFDRSLVGSKMFLEPVQVESREQADLPESKAPASPLGRHLNGCRIGFDLGGSDRKCAAVVDGKVVFSEEITWDPYFQTDVAYHRDGIQDTLERAAAHLPRVDAIGGSAAGIYMDNEPRAASLFRGIPDDVFDREVRPLFLQLQERWAGVPFHVINDGEVTALAGSMSLNDQPVLGIAMGTSLAAGYVDPEGNVTSWINELAFTPVDYRENAPVDEWSGDGGCGVQYFSQQAVARLAPVAGIELDPNMPFAEQLVEVQKLQEAGDPRTERIYRTIGTYLGYSLAHYADFYSMRYVLLLGRVTSGDGGGIIIEQAEHVLREEFPQLMESLSIVTPGEQDKRHGQAIAAASLPACP